MNSILKVVLAVYKFFVGDLVILLGVTLTMVILALIHFLGALATLRGGTGAILIAGVLVTLVAPWAVRLCGPRTGKRRNPSLLWVMRNRAFSCTLVSYTETWH